MYLLSSAYLPPVQYFTKLFTGETCLVEQHEHYVKQTYRNRCLIDSPNGVLPLTIPVEKFVFGKCKMKDVRISGHDDWRRKHWQALVSSYYNTPYFEYYQDDFRPFYEKKWEFLVDFNEELTLKCCELIDIEPRIQRTEKYFALNELSDKVMPEECVSDFRMTISPKVSAFEKDSFHPKEYYQVFAHKYGFRPNLSIVDLLFNMGPESVLVLRDSISPVASE